MTQSLATAHLLKLKLEVAFGDMLNIGATVQGRRRIAPVTGGVFAGERLNGVVLPGADWVINRPDGAMAIDVRIVLKTDGAALIYCSYQGVFKAAPEAMERFNRGEMLGQDEYRLRAVASFETGTERYLWLNDLLVVGVGQQRAKGPIYTLFEIV